MYSFFHFRFCCFVFLITLFSYRSYVPAIVLFLTWSYDSCLFFSLCGVFRHASAAPNTICAPYILRYFLISCFVRFSARLRSSVLRFVQAAPQRSRLREASGPVQEAASRRRHARSRIRRLVLPRCDVNRRCRLTVYHSFGSDKASLDLIHSFLVLEVP